MGERQREEEGYLKHRYSLRNKRVRCSSSSQTFIERGNLKVLWYFPLMFEIQSVKGQH